MGCAALLRFLNIKRRDVITVSHTIPVFIYFDRQGVGGSACFWYRLMIVAFEGFRFAPRLQAKVSQNHSNGRAMLLYITQRIVCIVAPCTNTFLIFKFLVVLVYSLPFLEGDTSGHVIDRCSLRMGVHPP